MGSTVVVQKVVPGPQKHAEPVKHVSEGPIAHATLKSREQATRPQETGCDIEGQIARARQVTGDHESRIEWITRAQADAQGMAHAAAWALPGVVTIVDSTPRDRCSYLPVAVAHEFYHEAQFRKTGGLAQAYEYYGKEGIERVAQCAAVMTGLPAYNAYDIKDTSACTADELDKAQDLVDNWVR